MRYIKEYKREILFFIILITALVIAGISITCFNSTKDNKSNDKLINNIDLNDVNNISAVESKLGYKFKITQGYLLTYTINKSSIWYISNAIVDNVKNSNGTTYITLTTNDKQHQLIGEIDCEKSTVKKGDNVNFVGNINLGTSKISLVKISKDTIDYNDVTKIDFIKLVNDINLINNNIFEVTGYMVTDGNKYKLYDTKSDYLEDDRAGNYFTINWNDSFNYTGNANVTLECKLNGTYSLKNCVLIK